MAVRTTTLAPISDTDANFRLWGSWISASFSAFGWVQASDTGQINWATVVKPAAGNTAQGFEIWKAGDALQATKPIYIKIEYGSGALAAQPSIWITVGSSTDGAGTITGSATTRQQMTGNVSSATAYPCYASGTTSRFTLAMWSTTAVACYTVLTIERSRDAAGTETGTGVQVVLLLAATSVAKQQWLEIGVSAATQESSLGVLLPSFGTLSKGSAVQLATIFLSDGNLQNPPLGLLAGYAANFSLNTTIAFTMYGASRTYLPVQANVTNRSNVLASSVLAVMLYE